MFGEILTVGLLLVALQLFHQCNAVLLSVIDGKSTTDEECQLLCKKGEGTGQALLDGTTEICECNYIDGRTEKFLLQETRALGTEKQKGKERARSSSQEHREEKEPVTTMNECSNYCNNIGSSQSKFYATEIVCVCDYDKGEYALVNRQGRVFRSKGVQHKTAARIETPPQTPQETTRKPRQYCENICETNVEGYTIASFVKHTKTCECHSFEDVTEYNEYGGEKN